MATEKTTNGNGKAAGRKQFTRMFFAVTLALVLVAVLWIFTAGVRAKAEALVSK